MGRMAFGLVGGSRWRLEKGGHGEAAACQGARAGVIRCSVASRKGNVKACAPSADLENGTWTKLICGASNQDVTALRNLALVYTMAGVSCIDAAADPAIVAAVREGVAAARETAKADWSPWIMISINDDEDPHFRKAYFSPEQCPSDCPRPCEAVCPANAIDLSGVIDERCYGCGRCVPICPLGLVDTKSYVVSPADILKQFAGRQLVDAIEIHTLPGHLEKFAALWRRLGPWISAELSAVAISFPRLGNDEEMANCLEKMYELMKPNLSPSMTIIWQTDGRPMSGDIGRGTARASVTLASCVSELLASRQVPGHVQVAGGTNDYTFKLVQAARQAEIPVMIKGAAFGGYARKRMATTVEALDLQAREIENERSILSACLRQAEELIRPWHTQ